MSRTASSSLVSCYSFSYFIWSAQLFLFANAHPFSVSLSCSCRYINLTLAFIETIGRVFGEWRYRILRNRPAPRFNRPQPLALAPRVVCLLTQLPMEMAFTILDVSVSMPA
ncbi:hypothetical protein M413DRAFT_190668 [Hebeloma cylindrosporum]|uniref:Uncharacterized protein n=1 Tax=Hebeloma cylindrosporum TaxID=76867 RepID=A0A0C3C733_HEBCY|nr:hypothetical protein M413DRAFT_190668 [Hebeloma cylindrosporum h7]